ncbi:MAG: GNAT family N-acetyltransferase [Nitrospiraceae bacterium]
MYRLLLERALSLAEQHRCLTLSVITNPFADDSALYERTLQPDFVFENFTQYVPLDQPVRRNHGHRNNVNRGRKAGFDISFCKSDEDLSAWYQIHRKRHQEIGATPLELRLFEQLFHTLVPRGKAQLLLLKKDGTIVSGGLYVYHRRVMDVFMLSFDSAWEKAAPNFLNTDYSMEWARGQGLTVYNWQSSANKRCGVYEYKRQWGSLDRPYHFLTKMFGSPDRIKALGPEGIKREYPWHYVVPFGVFETNFAQQRFAKG